MSEAPVLFAKSILGGVSGRRKRLVIYMGRMRRLVAATMLLYYMGT